MNNYISRLIALDAALLLTALLWAAPDPNFHCYLLFGQSNMAGGGNTTNLITADCDTTSRVKVLAFCDCSGSSPDCSRPLMRTHDQWYTAFPPLHSCSEGISPGDWFAKTMLDSIRSDITIGLIPCALSGQSIKVFEKGGSNFNIPNWAHPTIGNGSPYDWMIARCKIAQQTGVIKGILFHQGENDAGQSWWVGTTTGIFNDLKNDLGLSDIPIVVGELLQDAGACCAGHNTLIHQLASEMPNCAVASSQGLKMKSGDQYKAHLDAAGLRELGRRYAQAFLSLAGINFVPRKGVAIHTPERPRAVYAPIDRLRTGDVNVYSLDGKVLKSVNSPRTADMHNAGMRSGNVYAATFGPGKKLRLWVVP